MNSNYYTLVTGRSKFCREFLPVEDQNEVTNSRKQPPGLSEKKNLKKNLIRQYEKPWPNEEKMRFFFRVHRENFVLLHIGLFSPDPNSLASNPVCWG